MTIDDILQTTSLLDIPVPPRAAAARKAAAAQRRAAYEAQLRADVLGAVDAFEADAEGDSGLPPAERAAIAAELRAEIAARSPAEPQGGDRS